MSPRRNRCIFGCKRKEILYMHRFPNPKRQMERFKAWVSAAGDKLIETDPVKIYKNKRICDEHFTLDQKVTGHRLMHNSVPCVNLNGPFSVSAGFFVLIDHSYCDPRCFVTENSSGLSRSGQSSVKVEIGEDEKEITVGESNVNTTENESAENSENDLDDEVPHPTAPEAEEMPEVIFSWQKETDWLPTEIMADDIICPSMGEAAELPGPGECSMYYDDDPATDKRRDETSTSTELKPAEYQCNDCGNNIVGFRYTCVQCVDWDLCGACEARTAHATHYVLRVPSPRPYAEVQAVLTAIRQLLSANPLSNGIWLDESFKLEVKEELEDFEGEESAAEAAEAYPLAEGDPDFDNDVEDKEVVEEMEVCNEEEVEACPPEGPAAEPDPLAGWGPDLESVLFENEEIATDADDPPPRKRPRPAPSPASTEQHASLSPQHASLSPQHGSLSPQHGSLSPQHGSRSPQHASLSPQHASLSPQHGSLSPQHGSRSPQHASLSPQHASLSPQHASSSSQHQQKKDTTISTCDSATTTTVTHDNQTKLAQYKQTRKLADDNSAKLSAPIKKLIGINTRTGQLIYRQSKRETNTPARNKCPQNKPVSIDLTLSQDDATTRLPTVGVDKPTTGHRTGRQTARSTSVDDPPSPADTREPNTPSVAAEEKRKGLVLKVPPGTDTKQLFRALKSRAVEVMECVPAKKKKTESEINCDKN